MFQPFSTAFHSSKFCEWTCILNKVTFQLQCVRIFGKFSGLKKGEFPGFPEIWALVSEQRLVTTFPLSHSLYVCDTESRQMSLALRALEESSCSLNWMTSDTCSNWQDFLNGSVTSNCSSCWRIVPLFISGLRDKVRLPCHDHAIKDPVQGAAVSSRENRVLARTRRRRRSVEITAWL